MLISTHLSTISSMLPIPLNHIFQAWFTLFSQVSSQEAFKYTPSMFPGTPPRTFSSALLSMLSTTLLIAYDSILAVIYVLMSALMMIQTILPSMLSSMFAIVLHHTLPAYLVQCFQVCSQEARHSQFHKTIFSNICILVINLETSKDAAIRRLEVYHG